MTWSPLIPFKTIPNHSWDVLRSFVMIEKECYSCFVSWSHELWPENGMNQAIFSISLKQKTSLLHDMESIDSLQNHPKSFVGGIKIICDD
jgi:hypothetical protein